MTTTTQLIRLGSAGEELVGSLLVPTSMARLPALIVCHGAGEYKENYSEMCANLAEQGIVTFAIDLYGHGESGGMRFYVDIKRWVANIRTAIDFLSNHPQVDPGQIGAFGLSSGGTAILEAGIVDSRLKFLVALDATVRNSMPPPVTWFLNLLIFIGKLKLRLTGKTMRLPLAKLSIGPKMASDPDINRALLKNPRAVEAFMAFPLPGAEEAFFVDTIKRVSKINAATLIIWGEDDKLDPPKTGRLLLDVLSCKKRLEIVPGNGHVGHLDRNRAKVFSLTAEWILENASREPSGSVSAQAGRTNGHRLIEGADAKRMDRDEKWQLLSPFVRQHGREALAYATLQEGMEYFVNDLGYVSFITIRHPVFARKPHAIVLSDPVCSLENLPRLIDDFLEQKPRAAFGVVSEACAEVLHRKKFKVNCLGFEPEINIQTYNTLGNWKELDLIKRARNEVRREGIQIREEQGASLNKDHLAAISAKWMGSKKINDREIWIYARRPVFEHEEDVRKFVAYDKEGGLIGFAFYDPMYRDGKVFGYSSNISRCDEQRYGRLATAVHMEAVEKFKTEGKEVLNLLLSPFMKLDKAKFNDDFGVKLFFGLSARFGNNIYNFKGLSFHKSKYRGVEKSLYYASNSMWPANDIYLAFLAADITRSYFSTLGKLAWGMLTAARNGKD